MITHRDIYFKEATYMSGIGVPADPDGVVRNRHFINCDFHIACRNIPFENCIFERCTFLAFNKFTNATNCKIQ